MASIPFAAKALVGTVSALALDVSKPITLQEMVEDFCRQLENPSDVIANVMQSGSVTVLIHCKSERAAIIVLNSGLCFRGHPLDLKPAPSTTWIKLTRVMFGTTDNAIKSRLSDYGTVQKIRRETVNGIGISVYSVKMDLKKPIPSRITISHYPVNVFYRGQVQQCFRCEQTGHLSKNCPRKLNAPVSQPTFSGPVEMDIPPVSPIPVSSEPVPADEEPLASVSEEPVEVDIPPISPEPVSEAEELPASVSDASTDTPVNVDSGKRQHRSAADEHPAKLPKLTAADYVTYERERVRLYALADIVRDQDVSEFDELSSRIPPDLRETFKRTFVYRHPLLYDEDEGHLESEVRTAFAEGKQLSGVLDVSETSLYCPTLSPELAKVSPMVPYIELEEIVKPNLLRLFGFTITTRSKLSKDAAVHFRTQQMKLADAFMCHLYCVYPELLDKAKLPPETESLILNKIQNRDT